MLLRRIGAGLCIAASLLARPLPSAAHALVESAVPAMNSSVSGPDVAINVKFNSRIELKLSRLVLVLPDHSERPLTNLKADEPDRLVTVATGLAPGNYRLHWQVVAIDGHVTRGDIAFRVRTAGGQ
jgi:methionine-rich copper-binding protein CopC